MARQFSQTFYLNKWDLNGVSFPGGWRPCQFYLNKWDLNCFCNPLFRRRDCVLSEQVGFKLEEDLPNLSLISSFYLNKWDLNLPAFLLFDFDLYGFI